MTPKQLDAYLKRKGSPLAGLGSVFVSAAKRYGVDPKLLVAITGAETQFGKVVHASHNPFGWGPGIEFPSWEEAIDTVARGLRKGYIDQGLKTVAQIGGKWAPLGAKNDPTNLNSHWVKNVNTFLKELGIAPVEDEGPAAPTSPSPTPLKQSDLSSAVTQATLLNLGRGSPTFQLENLVAAVATAPRATVSPPGDTAPTDPASEPPQGGSFVFPIKGGKGNFSDTYGAPRPGGSKHYGTDIFAPYGTPVVAVRDGVITTAGNDGGRGGLRLWIDGRFYYAHLSRLAPGIKKGKKVKAGQVIGYVGTSGDAKGTPPHLHFGIAPNNDQSASGWTNPYDVLKGSRNGSR